MFLNFVFVLVYIARIYMLFSFTNEKDELTILVTQQGPLASYTTRKACLSEGSPFQELVQNCGMRSQLS